MMVEFRWLGGIARALDGLVPILKNYNIEIQNKSTLKHFHLIDNINKRNNVEWFKIPFFFMLRFKAVRVASEVTSLFAFLLENLF